jgi:hypothetical protein
MKYWTEGSPLRRDDNSHNAIPLPAFRPQRSVEAPGVTENPSDIVLCAGSVEVPRNTSGHWGQAKLFMSRDELSQFLDFLVQDNDIFRELFDKVMQQAKLNMDAKRDA